MLHSLGEAMKTNQSKNLFAAAFVAAVAFTTSLAQARDPLPSWNDGPAKQSITKFVEKVTKPGSPDFVPVPERIATFAFDERGHRSSMEDRQGAWRTSPDLDRVYQHDVKSRAGQTKISGGHEKR